MSEAIPPTFTHSGQNQHGNMFSFIYLHYHKFYRLGFVDNNFYCAQQRNALTRRTWAGSHQVESNGKQRQSTRGSRLSKATAQPSSGLQQAWGLSEKRMRWLWGVHNNFFSEKRVAVGKNTKSACLKIVRLEMEICIISWSETGFDL